MDALKDVDLGGVINTLAKLLGQGWPGWVVAALGAIAVVALGAWIRASYNSWIEKKNAENAHNEQAGTLPAAQDGQAALDGAVQHSDQTAPPSGDKPPRPAKP